MAWDKKADRETVEKTIDALKLHNINAYFVNDNEEARKKVLEILPEKAEVMMMTSVTLEKTGIAKEINESGNYDAVHTKLSSMDRKTHGKRMQEIGAAPEWAVGSVHAVTQDGKLVIASQTGSQLPAYAYGALNVIWVVGTQKIVRDLDEAFKRIYEYTLPLESERAIKAYGVKGSAVNKMLIINKEFQENRLNLIFVDEVLGF